MESCGSCSGSIAPTFVANTSLSLGMAIRDEDNKLGHKSPTSSPRVPSQEMLVEGAFKCKLCPRAFKNARALGGHQKAHRQLRAREEPESADATARPLKKHKAHNGARPAWSPAHILPSSYSHATALRTACLQAQPFADWRSHYDPSVCPVPPSFPWQTGTGGVTPAQLSAPAAGWTRDGDNLGREQGIREENQDESANGIDLSLKL